PVGAPLKTALDATPKRSTMILTNHLGQPWPPNAFASAWTRACKRADITGLTFNDLRGTAVTRLALAGCTEAEIAAITGHSLRDLRSILDLHYLLVTADPYFDTRREQIVAFAARQRLPSIYQFREYAVAGGLLSYGVSITDAYRNCGVYTAKILKGA